MTEEVRVYDDNRPCEVCGAPVRLAERTVEDSSDAGPVGPEDGVVGTADPTVDERICTNDACPSRADASDD